MMNRTYVIFLFLVMIDANCVGMQTSHGFEPGDKLGQQHKIPISFLVPILHDNIWTFSYIPNQACTYKRSDPAQIKEIESLNLITHPNYRTMTANATRMLDDSDIKPFTFPNDCASFLSALSDFLSNQLHKQCVGFKQERDKTMIYTSNNRSWIEDDAGRSLKKTTLWLRGGQKIQTDLQVQCIHFSKYGLSTSKLNGAFGLLTQKGKLKLEQYLSMPLTVAQATIVGNVGNTVLGAKGTIGIPVSPGQHALVDGIDDCDMMLNLDECCAFENTQLPTDNINITLPADTLSIMKILDHQPCRHTNFAIIHLLHLINNPELIESYKKLWFNSITQSLTAYQQRTISQTECKEELASLAYFCTIPHYTRYLWADESLLLHEILVPQSLADAFPVGKNVAILSHPLLFTLNYAVVTIKGYTESQAFILSPELCTHILRDQDGDILSIALPEFLPLASIHLPQKMEITMKKNIVNLPRTNDIMIELMGENNRGIIYTVNSLTDLYVHLLEHQRYDLIDAYIIEFARFYQASLDRMKKKVNENYLSDHLDAFMQEIYTETYHTPPPQYPANADRKYTIPPHSTFSTLKKLKSIIKDHAITDTNTKFDTVKKLIASPTNIPFLHDIWTHLYQAMDAIA